MVEFCVDSVSPYAIIIIIIMGKDTYPGTHTLLGVV